MTAYAHTATLPDSSTEVYPYIAIGVYEASTDGTRLLSTGDRTPLSSRTYNTFRNLANALTSAGRSGFQMQNFYHWTLVKMMAYAVMGTKNSQWMMGDGPVDNASPSTTGLADQAGPYAQSTSQYSKMLVENPWGSVWAMLGDVMLSDYAFCAGNSLGGAELGGQTPVQSGAVMPATAKHYVLSASNSSDAWDLPLTTGSTDTSSDPAYTGDNCQTASGQRAMLGGGPHTYGAGSGIATLYGASPLATSHALIGTRLSAYLDDYAVGLTDEAPVALSLSAPLTLSMGQSTLDEEEAEEPEEESAEPTEEPEETPEESEEEPEEDMR